MGQSLDERLAALKQKQDGDYINAEDIHTLVEGIEYASGSGEGTSDYNKLESKPSINGHTLSGSMSSKELGIINQVLLNDGTAIDPDQNGNIKLPAIPQATGIITSGSSAVPTSAAVDEALEKQNLLVAKTEPYTSTQKYNASANINDRAAVVTPGTNEVEALGYRVLDPLKPLSAQVQSDYTIYEVRDEFVGNSQELHLSIDSRVVVPTGYSNFYVYNTTVEVVEGQSLAIPSGFVLIDSTKSAVISDAEDYTEAGSFYIGKIKSDAELGESFVYSISTDEETVEYEGSLDELVEGVETKRKVCWISDTPVILQEGQVLELDVDKCAISQDKQSLIKQGDFINTPGTYYVGVEDFKLYYQTVEDATIDGVSYTNYKKSYTSIGLSQELLQIDNKNYYISQGKINSGVKYLAFNDTILLSNPESESVELLPVVAYKNGFSNVNVTSYNGIRVYSNPLQEAYLLKEACLDVLVLEKLTVGESCDFKFVGGCIENYHVVGNNTTLSGDVRLGNKTYFSGIFNLPRIDPSWFEAEKIPAYSVSSTVIDKAHYNAVRDNAPAFNAAVRLYRYSPGAEYYIPTGAWAIKTKIQFNTSVVRIKGEGKNSILVIGPTEPGSGQFNRIGIEFNSGKEVSGYIKDFAATGGDISENNWCVRGTLLYRLHLSGGEISNIDIRRLGMFCYGEVYGSACVSRIYAVGLSFALFSRRYEANFDNEPTSQINSNVVMDSVIQDCYINAIQIQMNYMQSTYNRTVLNGSITTSVISNNFFDYWPYLVNPSNTYHSGVFFGNRFIGNIFDICLRFNRNALNLSESVFNSNTIRKSKISTIKSSWKSTIHPLLKQSRSLFFNFHSVGNCVIENNTFKTMDDVLQVNGWSTNNCKFEVFESMLRKSKWISNKSDSTYNVLINGEDVFAGVTDNYARRNLLKIISTVPYRRTYDNSNSYYDFGKEYFMLKIPIKRYDKGYFYEISSSMVDSGISGRNGYPITSIKIGSTTATVEQDTQTQKVYGCFMSRLFALRNAEMLADSVDIFNLGIGVQFSPSNPEGLVQYYLMCGNLQDSKLPFIVDALPETDLFINRVVCLKVDDIYTPYRYSYSGWVEALDSQGNSKGEIPLRNYGSTTQRPNAICHSRYLFVGARYFDTDNNVFVTWNGSDWV